MYTAIVVAILVALLSGGPVLLGGNCGGQCGEGEQHQYGQPAPPGPGPNGSG